MMAHFKTIVGGVLVLCVAAWCMRLWQPERQIRLHQRHLLDAAGRRDWAKLNRLMDDNFRTAGGLDKGLALKAMAEVLQPFLTLEITGSETGMKEEERTARVLEILRIDGMGSGFSDSVKTAVNQSSEPFEFTWQRKSWKPWDWRLVGARHSLIALTPQEAQL